MKFVAHHGPFDQQPSEDVAEKCPDCDAVVLDDEERMWLGKWVVD